MAENLPKDVGVWCADLRAQLPPEQEFVIKTTNPDTHTAILIRDKQASPWLLAETSHYEPDTEAYIHGQIELDGSEYPFSTYGTQWLIDLEKRRFTEREFEAEEGTIQGFVYAAYAIIYGGELPTPAYLDFLRNEIHAATAERVFKPLSLDRIARLLRGLGKTAI